MSQAVVTTTANESTINVASTGPSLREMLEDGVYLLFLLKDGNAPGSSVEFNRRIDQFLLQYERNARNFGKSVEAIGQAKYAFCALLDEIILSSDFSLRDEWERMPLQLRLFGEHLAGEGFFNRLEQLRLEPARHIEELEVYYTCLLLGFQGRYLLEGEEKLGYLTHKLGQEIQQVRGGKAEFAPNWQLPQRFQAYVRHELPLWLYFALLALAGAAIWGTYHWLLGRQLSKLFGI
ncbi:type IV/VI secretion system protein, DotU family [Pseudogulbenkiania sp. NH8B]|uniref:type IVB secretion system protein IcmH/DotU n=1 Tax=Pseudogulbenkiania sp. (strain NH8B) TaxID=748280 RepID=UPI0002279C7E|nr:type IVB secretion system protein IcmH/DotU [Pseudogulbenkiania sp. NH8B]BAK75950.1 type IV/VI secretion system protein, DotU family [Pseudogulbenkiania sp. NH8B]